MSVEFKDGLTALLPQLRGYARSFERDAARADDLVQEALLKAWEKRDRFEPGSNLKAWVFAILRNQARSQFRKSSREVEDVDGEYADALSTGGMQEARLENLELQAALARLPAEQREAVILICACGVSYQEGARISGISVDAMKTRVSRARKGLVELTTAAPKRRKGLDAVA